MPNGGSYGVWNITDAINKGWTPTWYHGGGSRSAKKIIVKKRRRTAMSRLYRRVNSIEMGKYKELKTYDATNGGVAIGTSSDIDIISNMAQGDTSILREGLVIQPRNLQVKFQLRHNASAVNTNTRVIIFKDRECHGTYPTATNLLETDSTTAWKEHDTRPRFKIYRDIMIPQTNTGDSGNVWYKTIIQFSKKSKIWYQGVDGTEASQGKNALFILAVSDDNTNKPTITWFSRLRFVDG